MRNFLIGSAAIIGLAGLILTGTGHSAARAQIDYRYIPNDHRPLTFRNDDGSLHHRSRRRPRGTQKRRASEQYKQRSLRTESAERLNDRRDGVERSAESAALICPVTGDKIASIKDAVGQSTYKGKTYYFCCDGCKPRFDKDPAKFVRNSAAGKYDRM